MAIMDKLSFWKKTPKHQKKPPVNPGAFSASSSPVSGSIFHSSNRYSERVPKEEFFKQMALIGHSVSEQLEQELNLPDVLFKMPN